MASRLSIKKNPTGNCKKSKSVTIASAALFRHFAGQASLHKNYCNFGLVKINLT
jgi:hypothetical protein